MGDTARVLNIQRMSTEDGPGIRTTVFFKGCTLACDWCHNPESIDARPQVQWADWKCLHCGACADVCPTGAIGAAGQECRVCGRCVDECPAAARELAGREWTVDALAAEVAKDAAYFRRSGGGVTASGGEPTVQAGFVAAFLARCRDLGMHAALDTCGMCSEAVLLRTAAAADLVLFDLKLMDPDLHRRHTGHSNERILENVVALAAQVRAGTGPAALWIRTPLIPGATATDFNVHAIGRFIAERLGDVVERWDLCAFNNLCRDQYRRLGVAWAYAATPLLTSAELDHFRETAVASGVPGTRVRTSGPCRAGAPDPATGTRKVKTC